jgi:hypothetical protein
MSVLGTNRRAGLAWGAIFVAAYVATVALSMSGGWPARLLFDGVGPPNPYAWVSPPPDRVATNQKPQSARRTAKLTAAGSPGLSVSTPDGQAALVAPKGAFPPAAGQPSVLITITPSDPAHLGPPPAGLLYQGNAYTFDARYQRSGDPAPLVQPVSVLLQYPVHATVILRRDGQTWTPLKSTPVPASLQVFGDTTKIGVLVAAGPKPATKRNLLPYISGGAILLAAVGGLIARRGQNRRREAAARAAAAAKKRAPGAKPRPNRSKGRRRR